jgi:hypothetical protein
VVETSEVMKTLEDIHKRVDIVVERLCGVEDIVLQLNSCDTQPTNAPTAEMKKLAAQINALEK